MHGAAGKGVECEEILEVADATLHPVLRDAISAQRARGVADTEQLSNPSAQTWVSAPSSQYKSNETVP